jgi:hypothetical protein
MAEQDGGASKAGGDPTPGSGDNKVAFTPEQQEYVNKIVSTRVNETKTAFAKAEEDSRILQNMFKDPDFIAWVNGDRSTPAPGGVTDPMEELLNKDSLSGKEVVAILQKFMGEELKPLKSGLDNVARTTQTLGVDQSLQRLASEVNPKTGEPMYPYLWDQEFKAEVQGMLGKRAANPIDAYYLVERDRQVNGKGVPQTAYLLEGSGSIGGRARRGGLVEAEPETLKSLGVNANKQGKINIRDVVRSLIDKQGG